MNEEPIQEGTISQEYVKAKPEDLPKPTYIPFLLAFSLLLLAWGLIAIWIISVAGIIGMCISIYAWVKELLYEH
jgi:hypothetical protein